MDISPELKNFLDQNIESVEQMESLALLVETSPQSWTFQAIVAKLYGSPESITRRLSLLENLGLIIRDTSKVPPEFHYHEKFSQDALVRSLVALYRQKRSRVIEIIFSKNESQIRKFSEAFRFRQKDDPHG